MTNLTKEPYLLRCIPNQGPMGGGTEVSILGENFHEGLKVFFGDVEAHSEYWGPKTIICVSPPVYVEGSVNITLNEPTKGEELLYYYIDTTKKDLIDLSFQVMQENGEFDFENLMFNFMSNPTPSSSSEEEPTSEIEFLTHELKKLDNKTCLNKTDAHGRTLLILAAIGGQHKLTRFLCSTKEVDVNIVDRNGLTALMHACKLGYQGIVEVLMETKKVNLKIVDKYGRDCFKLGGRSRSIETVLTKYQTQHELNKIIYGLSDTTISPPTPKIVQQQQILPPTYITHIVQNEDTLSGISLKYNVSQEEIKQLNHIINIHSTNSLLIPIKQKSSQVPLGTIPQLTPPKISKNFAMELISNFAKKKQNY